ncbi:MAG: NAD(P)/FAD-dependent oxidoreductase [Myxococcota bacterium]
MIDRAVVVGAGPVGIAMALALGRCGVNVRVLEKRSRLECTRTEPGGARTVSLSISPRGMRALDAVSVGAEVRARAVQMDSRVLHFPDGTLDEKDYGAPERVNYAIERGALAAIMIEEAAALETVQLSFETRCVGVDVERGHLQTDRDTWCADLVVGADGTRSAVRDALVRQPGFSFGQEFFPAGYIELPLVDTGLNRRAIHIWRGHRPVVGLPARDGGIRGTLVLPLHGDESFEAVASPDALLTLLRSIHPELPVDVRALRRTFDAQRFGRLVTIRCDPYTMGNTMLVGDAAHAMCPFMGQGVNVGLEDVEVFARLFAASRSLPACLDAYDRLRGPEGRAAAELSLWNYTELGGVRAAQPSAPLPPNAPPIVLVNFFPVSYQSVLQAARQAETPRSHAHVSP